MTLAIDKYPDCFILAIKGNAISLNSVISNLKAETLKLSPNMLNFLLIFHKIRWSCKGIIEN